MADKRPFCSLNADGSFTRLIESALIGAIRSATHPIASRQLIEMVPIATMDLTDCMLIDFICDFISVWVCSVCL